MKCCLSKNFLKDTVRAIANISNFDFLFFSKKKFKTLKQYNKSCNFPEVFAWTDDQSISGNNASTFKTSKMNSLFQKEL